VARAEAYLHAKFHLDPSDLWPPYTNVTDRTGQTDRTDRETDNGLIAYDEPFYIWSPNKLMIVMLNIKNLAETLYKVTGYSCTLTYYVTLPEDTYSHTVFVANIQHL